jgi:hypothetical protein
MTFSVSGGTMIGLSSLSVLLIMFTAKPGPLRFSCDASGIPVDASAASLVARFGRDQVTTEIIELGEGFTRRGTVVFAADPRRRVEIFWQDSVAERLPETISVRGNTSDWITPTGITLGTSLQSVERLNGRPFHLAGFGFDGSGYITNWAGGRLGPSPRAACDLHGGVDPRLRTPADHRRERMLSGDRDFMSNQPDMHALNPRVDRLLLEYRRR